MCFYYIFLDESLVIMAAGGKDVGKSTFLRLTVNSLLNE
jgi:polynucleotide 5'-kinase involved in rRNA processing